MAHLKAYAKTVPGSSIELMIYIYENCPKNPNYDKNISVASIMMLTFFDKTSIFYQFSYKKCKLYIARWNPLCISFLMSPPALTLIIAKLVEKSKF